MKMKLQMLIFLLLTSSVLSQDNEPEPWEFKWGFSSTPIFFVMTFPYNFIYCNN